MTTSSSKRRTGGNTPPHRPLFHAFLILLFVFLAVGLAAALAVIFAPVDLTLGEDGYTLSFLFYEESALYADVTEVALLDDTYASDRIKSYGGISKEFGTYRNELYGDHFRLTCSENKHNYILLKRKDGSITVFNLKTVSATEQVYDSLVKKLSER